MAAYVIADIQVTDAVDYDRYRPLAAASIASFGGRFVVRGGEIDLLEGELQPERVVANSRMPRPPAAGTAPGNIKPR